MNQAARTGHDLAKAYEEIGRRGMDKLPFYNGRLTVEAVGYREWEGHIIGVLIAPWFMNLVLVPGTGDDWSEFAAAEATEWKFPHGKYEFHPCDLHGADLHLTAALFSDMGVFPDQITARAVAVEVMRQLFEHPDADAGKASSPGQRLLERPVSRRGLFTMVAAAGETGSETDA